MVSEVPGRGRWVPVFSTLERLAAFAGMHGQYQQLTGVELLRHVPKGIGVLFDVQDTHALPLIPRRDGLPRFATPPS